VPWHIPCQNGAQTAPWLKRNKPRASLHHILIPNKKACPSPTQSISRHLTGSKAHAASDAFCSALSLKCRLNSCTKALVMDSVTITPMLCSFNFNFSNPQIKPIYSTSFSFFRFTHFRKLRTSSITFCYRSDSNPKKQNSKFSNRIFPPNPIWVWVPVLQSIKSFAASQAQKWVSNVQACNDSEKILDEISGGYLQNGGIGVALLSVTSNAKVRISPFVATLAANPTFVSGLFAWFIAQSIKMVLNFFVERKWDLRILFASGGMPSSHSALCTALTTSVALCHGIADSLFPVCLGFSLIVMYDAIGVRRHAGMQAEVRCEFLSVPVLPRNLIFFFFFLFIIFFVF
jgi:acid phosphatase family membrane protein YuiD